LHQQLSQAGGDATRGKPQPQEQIRKRLLIRKAFGSRPGNRFRPVVVDPAWLVAAEGTVLRLAQALYDSRDFRAMPVLGDALEDAGCCDPVILEHCRRPGEHYRGCFLVDALLGKT
jgi:hypothetical protein